MTAIEITHRSQPEPQRHFVTNGGTDSEPDAFYFQFDPEGRAIPRAIVDAVALVHNSGPTELSPLAEAVDPDAMAALLLTNATSIELSFTYEGMDVTVNSDGDIWLEWAR